MENNMTSDDRDEKLRRILASLMTSQAGQKMVAEVAFAHGHKMLPRVEFMQLPPVTDPERLARAQTGVILDTETTGFEAKKDKVIQISMMKFQYDELGIISFGEIFDRFRDPGFPIPPETTKIHRITDEMVCGKTLECGEIAAYLDGVSCAIAHNAEFDRRFVEEDFPLAGFDKIAWHCSMAQVDWKARGHLKTSLEMLALGSGFVYDAHNARSDILATAFVLAAPGPEGRPSAFVEMLDEAANSPRHIFAVRSPFHSKDDLSARGYRWAPEDKPVQGYAKVWHKVISGRPEILAEEAEFLEGIYGKPVSLPMVAYTGLTRYSTRPAQICADFCTRQNLELADRVKMAAEGEPDGFVSARSTL